MIFFKELTLLVLVTVIVSGSPFGKVQKIAIVDGVPFTYGNEEAENNPNPDEMTHPSNSGEEIGNDVDVVEGLVPTSSPKEIKRSALRFAIARRSQGLKEDTSGEKGGRMEYKPAISVGAMMNLRDFFDSLKGNVDAIQTKALSPQEFRALTQPVESFRSVSSQYVEDSHIQRPTANAAYLHAMRMYRPSPRIRALVAHHPESYRGANNYNPSYLWTGLG